MEHLIELKDVYKIYQMGDETVHALDGVSLAIDPGEFVAIVGSSGSGKSTAMNIIGCLDVPTSGTYHLGGVDVSTMDDDDQAEIRNKMLGFIFQQYNLIPKLNVLENVELPLLYAGVDAAERRERAMSALSRVGLTDKGKNLPSQLSGGQQQRVAIARAISTHPPIIMADEPTGALDSRTGHEVLGFLQQLNKEGSTVILITHDMGVVAETADNILVLYAGKVVEYGSVKEIFNTPKHPYTKGLLSSIPPLEEDVEELNTIEGTVPGPGQMPVGCRFSPRCPYADERCVKEQPGIYEAGGAKVSCFRYEGDNYEK